MLANVHLHMLDYLVNGFAIDDIIQNSARRQKLDDLRIDIWL